MTITLSIVCIGGGPMSQGSPCVKTHGRAVHCPPHRESYRDPVRLNNKFEGSIACEKSPNYMNAEHMGIYK